METKENYLYKLIPGLLSEHEHHIRLMAQQSKIHFMLGFDPFMIRLQEFTKPKPIYLSYVECQISYLKYETLTVYLLGNAKL